jgi:hypothetical protein
VSQTGWISGWDRTVHSVQIAVAEPNGHRSHEHFAWSGVINEDLGDLVSAWGGSDDCSAHARGSTPDGAAGAEIFTKAPEAIGNVDWAISFRVLRCSEPSATPLCDGEVLIGEERAHRSSFSVTCHPCQLPESPCAL